MPKLCYTPKRFKPETYRTIAKANALLDKYVREGVRPTVRTLYYRFVAHDLFPKDRTWLLKGGKWVRSPRGTTNAEPNYKWLGGILGDARLAGLLDWDHLDDLTRNLMSIRHHDGPQDAINSMANSYRIDMWEHQTHRPEVWIEKNALVGSIERVCAEHDVPYFSCRGYTSLSEMWQASMRLRRHVEGGQVPYIIHFGDHDPSGMDMSHDIFNRLQTVFMADIEFKRVALNMDQIELYKPPPNPAKVTDSRYKAYLSRYGDSSWELDSLEPTQFRGLIEGELESIRDEAQWKVDLAREEETRKRLLQVAEDWDKPREPPQPPEQRIIKKAARKQVKKLVKPAKKAAKKKPKRSN